MQLKPVRFSCSQTFSIQFKVSEVYFGSRKART